MTKIRVISDLHLEFTNDDFELPVVDDESSTVLVVAGDLGVVTDKRSYVPFLTEMSSRFQTIVYPLGNHEYYGSNIHDTDNQLRTVLRSELPDVKNIHVGPVVHVVNDIVIIATTLWSNMDNRNPVVMHEVKQSMNDFNRITQHKPGDPPYSLQPNTVADIYDDSSTWIKGALTVAKNSGRTTVLVTHHAPSFQSIAPEYVNSPLNGAFASEFYNPWTDSDIMPDIHIHGHVHNSLDYQLGDTRVICNPRGYAFKNENPEFDPLLTINV